MNLIDRIDKIIIEQSFSCPECGHKFSSEWKNKAKCKECGCQMHVKEGVYGKKKSKKWFEYRGKIVATKSKEQLSALLHKITKEVGPAELQDLTNQVLVKMNKLR